MHDYKLAEGFDFSLVPNAPGNGSRWAQLVRLGDERPEWAKPKVFFRFCDYDPFRELEPAHGSNHRRNLYTQDGKDAYRQEVRDEVDAFVHKQCVERHLTAVFVVILHESTFRLSRWDRSGTLFSHKVDYVQRPTLLPDLFWRLSMLTDEQLGWDPTVTPVLPGSPEYVLMEDLRGARADDFPMEPGSTIDGDPHDASRVFAFVRKAYNDSLSTEARWKISVPRPDSTSRDFLVGRPFVFPSTEDLRTGRPHIAVDCDTKTFMFLKDAWRYTTEDAVRPREGQVLAELNKASVPHVPTVVCEEDLPGQGTVTDTFFARTPEVLDCENIESVYAVDDEGIGYQPKKHYRVVVREICRPLQCVIKSGTQLLAGLRDCIVGELFDPLTTHEIC